MASLDDHDSPTNPRSTGLMMGGRLDDYWGNVSHGFRCGLPEDR